MLKPGQEMGIDEWKRLIETYSNVGVSQFSFTGGEALLKEGCLELVDFASKKAHVGILSNGRIMTEDVLKFCAERNVHVMMSMPGLKSFGMNTDSDTSVGHILSMFSVARELGCQTTVGIAVTKLNLPELYETISAALIAGADSLLLNRFLPGGRGLSHPELILTREEVNSLYRCHLMSRSKRLLHNRTSCEIALISSILLIATSKTKISHHTITRRFLIDIVLDPSVVIHFIICRSTMSINNSKISLYSPRLWIGI
jgi:MoaA/NifB/PqqE/SkfB family radical SAM enzyme